MNLARVGVRNPVVVNLLMWAIIIGGLVSWFGLIREVLPNSDAEQIVVTVAYPGATPDEVERSVALRLERELRGVSDVEEIASEILEGAVAMRLSLEQNADLESVLNDVRTEVDRVRPDLPEGTLEPEIRALRPFFPVISVVVHGDVAEERLRDTALDVRDDLLDLPEISETTISGTRDREIWVEIFPEKLEEERLTFQQVGDAVTRGNLDLPGGQLEGERGNVRVRTVGETQRASELSRLVVAATPDGGSVRLTDVADVRETFEDKVEIGRFNGERAAIITVLKTPEQDAVEIADLVKGYIAENPELVGGAIQLSPQNDLSRFVLQRLDLMVRNARMGLILVCIALAIFLDLRVAFWVAVGLPVSFLGTFVVMELIGVSVNLISLFGLIVVLGLIVDDAIVIAENVFTKMRSGVPAARAAVEGAGEVSLPVLAAVLTTIAAFAPLAFLDGRLGAFLGQLPLVVMAALAVSLIEAFLILPAHLGHQRVTREEPRFPKLADALAKMAAWRVRWFEERLPRMLERVLRFALRWRYPALAALLATTMIVVGTIRGGIVPFVLLQNVDAENVTMELEMAAGTPVAETERTLLLIDQMIRDHEEVGSTFTVVGTSFSDRGRETAADPATVGQVQIEMVPSDEREVAGLRPTRLVMNELRQSTAGLPGVTKLAFLERAGGPSGADIEIRVRNEDRNQLGAAVNHVREVLGSYDGVYELEDDLRSGKLEVQLSLGDQARSLGLTTRDLAIQTRHALFGLEAQDLQQADGEVTVRVLLPESARTSIADLGRLRIATPNGERVPLSEIASLETSRGPASLARVDGKRAVTIKASVDSELGNVSEITGDLSVQLSAIGGQFPGTSLSFEGKQKQTRESVGSLRFLFPVALLVIYAMLAALFRSYMQPLLVMSAIPYALVGAVVGHLIMGYPFTLLSMIGSVALAGIVVNDSLILVEFVNRRRREMGMSTIEAVVDGAKARMRAIMLTSITTVAGLAPIMLERSFQAQFLIPMAISIVFGLTFATGLTLVALPTMYVIFEDLRAAVRWMATGRFYRDLPSGA